MNTRPLIVWKKYLTKKKLYHRNFFLFLQGICFTILCWFLPYINMNQPQVYMCPLPLEPPSHHPVSIAAFFTLARTWKQPRYPVTRMDTEIAVHIYNGMLLSLTKECI